MNGEIKMLAPLVKVDLKINRCTGHCCDNFVLNFSYAEVLRRKKAIENGDKYYVRDSGDSREIFAYDEDSKKVLDMVIYKGPTKINPNGGEVFTESITKYQEEYLERCKKENKKPDMLYFIHHYMNKGIYQNTEGDWVMDNFTCKHFDTESRNCTIYKDRPSMCRTCPKSCSYEGCTASKDAFGNVITPIEE